MSYTQPQPYSLQRAQEVPDGVLIGRAQAGDQCSFECLVNRYHRSLASYIDGFLKDGEQVYLQLYLSLPTLRTDVQFKGWLLQVTRNRCLDELRKRRRQAEAPFSRLAWDAGEKDLSPLEAIPDPQPLPHEVAERVEVACLLRRPLLRSHPGSARSCTCAVSGN